MEGRRIGGQEREEEEGGEEGRFGQFILPFRGRPH